MFSVAVITVSDRSSAGEREDRSGPEIVSMLDTGVYVVTHREIVPDEESLIRETLQSCVDRDIALVLTTGGTGFAPRDVTPEATLSVIDRRADGFSEAMRMVTYAKTNKSILSRGVSGIRNRTLIINLPGSPKAVRECLEVILPILPHALGVLHGSETEHDGK